MRYVLAGLVCVVCSVNGIGCDQKKVEAASPSPAIQANSQHTDRSERLARLEAFVASLEVGTGMTLEQLEQKVAAMPGNAYRESDQQAIDAYREAGRRAMAASMLSQLMTIRAQCELYRNQHHNACPDFLGQGWRQLIHSTRIDGDVSSSTRQHIYGPYLRHEPFNDMNGSASICLASEIDPQAGWAFDPNSGSLYAVVSDQDAVELGLDTEQDVRTYSAVAVEAVSVLIGDLAVLRNAIDLYAAEHGGVFPSESHIARQLKQYSDASGNVSRRTAGAYIYGPYIRRIPENPVSSFDAICSANAMADSAGWVYDEKTGSIAALLEAGNPITRTLKFMMPGDIATWSLEVVDAE